VFTEHHLSHAASAFFPSPYEKAVVLTMDGVGEWATTSLAMGQGAKLDIHQGNPFPALAGSALFGLHLLHRLQGQLRRVQDHGACALWRRRSTPDKIRDNLIDVKDDGSYRLNMDYFDYCTGLTMTNAKFDALFGGPPRKAEQLLTQRDMDLTASVQHVLEEVVLKLAPAIAKENGMRETCVLRAAWRSTAWPTARCCATSAFENIWIQPASGDAGGALGAALVGLATCRSAAWRAPCGFIGRDGKRLPTWGRSPTSRPTSSHA
jgi:carbamoyltransferase